MANADSSGTRFRKSAQSVVWRGESGDRYSLVRRSPHHGLPEWSWYAIALRMGWVSSMPR